MSPFIYLPHCICHYRYPGKPSASESPVTGPLRISIATLSISSYELNAPFLSHLLYVSVSVSVSPFMYCALVDSGATINLIHKAVVSLLDLTVQPHPGLQVTLADGKTVLSCPGFVSLSCVIAGISSHGVFFVAPLGVQSMILGMPFLEEENPAIDWTTKTLMPRSALPALPPQSLLPALSIPTPIPTPPRRRYHRRLPHSSHPIDTIKPKSVKLDHCVSYEEYTDSETPSSILEPCPKRRLPLILPTRHINAKRDQLLAFTIIDVTGYKEAITAAINLDPTNPDLDLDPEPIANAVTPLPIPFEYAKFADVFEEKETPQLPLHRSGVDHEIPLAPGSKPFYGPIYNLSETELRYLKDYIDRMLA